MKRKVTLARLLQKCRAIFKRLPENPSEWPDVPDCIVMVAARELGGRDNLEGFTFCFVAQSLGFTRRVSWFQKSPRERRIVKAIDRVMSAYDARNWGRLWAAIQPEVAARAAR